MAVFSWMRLILYVSTYLFHVDDTHVCLCLRLLLYIYKVAISLPGCVCTSLFIFVAVDLCLPVQYICIVLLCAVITDHLRMVYLTGPQDWILPCSIK